MKTQFLRNIMVQIATPHSTGTGFIIGPQGYILTSEHVVRDNKEVVVYGKQFRQQVVDVLFLDEKYDLALLALPAGFEGQYISLLEPQVLQIGQCIVSAGHPYGANFETSEGEITALDKINYGIPFIYHTAHLSMGFSGGPLVDEEGNLIGLNTFVELDGKTIGYALPLSILKEQINTYLQSGHKIAAICGNCESLISENSIDAHSCPHCQYPVQLSSTIENYEAQGMAATIEELLKTLGYDPVLTRRGPNNWDIQKGSAHINISFYEKSGLIIGDSYLCSLPTKNRASILAYLLQANDQLKGLTLSIKGEDVVLSLLIYDRYFDLDTGKVLFKNLFKKADDLDNILIEKYGAEWIKEPPTIQKLKI